MNYEWFQDEQQIKVRFDIKNTTIANIDVQIADLLIKVNVLDKKMAKIIDLLDFVMEGDVVYGNNILEVTVIKKEHKKWATLTPEMNKQDLIKRRQESFARKEQENLALLKQKEELKIELERVTTKEQMKLEDDQRKNIDNIKKEQKTQAEEAIYGQLDSQANFKKQVNVPDSEDDEPAPKVQTKQQTNKAQSNQIFKSSEVAQAVQTEIPEPRKQTSVQIKFTDKIYPHLAAREQHAKDAPLPRQGKLTQKDHEDRQNPLFLKDKADEFFRNKDFYSAINAYSGAYKLDQNLIVCISNRAACYLNLYNFDECLQDCQTIIDLNRDDKLHDKAIKRRMICLAWKGDLEAAEKCEQLTELVQKRIQSNKYKYQADSYLNNLQYDKAIQMYDKSLEFDQNELSHSNLGLIYMKTNQIDQALNHINQAIEIAKPFILYTNLNPNIGRQSCKQAHDFLLKNYLRKANCQFQQNNEEQALISIKHAIKIDETNEEARGILNKIQAKIVKNEALKLKDQATENLKNKQYLEALNLYNECLKKLTPQEDLLDFLTVLLNKCLCSFYLEQYEDIIGGCTRGIKLITTQKNKILSFEAITKEHRQKLTEYQVRFLVRRSNAHIKLKQQFNAKQDLEEALLLDPTNEQIQKDLNKFLQ